MNDQDPTTVIKMLNDLKSTTESYRRNSGVALRLSGAGFTTPLPTSTLDTGDRLRVPPSFPSTSGNTGLPLSEDNTSSVTVSSHNDEQTPPKRKRTHDMSDSFSNSIAESAPASPWEWRRLRAEVVSLRTRLSHQEGTVQQLHKLRNQLEEVFQKEKNVLEMQAELDKQTIKQLEWRVESIRKTAQEAREAHNNIESEMFQMKRELEQKISNLIEENSKLSERAKHSNENNLESSSSVSSPKNQAETDTQEKLEMAEKRIAELEEKLRDNLVLQKEYELQKIELQNCKMNIEKLESERSLWEEGKTLLTRAARANELEKELQVSREIINGMRESVKGKLLLEEQMSNMMQRLEHTEKVEHQAATLEVRCNELMGKLKEYESIGIGADPLSLKREINRLQQAEAILTSEEGQLRSRIESVQRENQNLQRKYEDVKKLANESSVSIDRLNKLVGRLQKKMLLVTRERDSYKQQLDLYEKEMTVDVNSTVNERIPALERTLEGYRDLVSKLEADLDSVDSTATRKECQRLREEVDKLKGELEHRVLKGDFNCNARILHFKMNPAAVASQQAEEKMAGILREVEELRARVQLGNTDAPIGVSSVHAQEIAELKQSHEIKIARLKDVFKASSHEYRQACYQLFGWRVDRTKEGRYKLSSQYAESPDDFLYFQVGEGVDLLETQFSATLEHFIERHLKKQHSVPMFLNAVQAELFSQQTATNMMA
ncbi:Similar to MAD1L1: Mitotic spindle assembly checkpoint protein MAD1 (Homo sapiens) [Cotesia congregata]|uniref:Similar to MAD1L1: Mitotic spindle assembly checkpoint protein MAD1 (Homo sapiens) n=1 Tax=Cotesia congregata TaxID=51543 RepID=A0A8J2HMY6_COTCN|nr:Similar to MAD1L1: Mitotic spindle assembly checkpoint protein MAD1 (Homo sapiens) [Cotesia congregata]